jgi:hypothetical protein
MKDVTKIQEQNWYNIRTISGRLDLTPQIPHTYMLANIATRRAPPTEKSYANSSQANSIISLTSCSAISWADFFLSYQLVFRKRREA